MRFAALCFALLLPAASASAVNVVLDYTYAAGSFFNESTTNGQKARATVQAAADYFSEILDDSLAEVRKPDNFQSTVVPSFYTEWNWEAKFSNPSTGLGTSISNPIIPADEYRIYVGARDLGASTLGSGGPGAWSRSPASYYSADEATVKAIDEEFIELLTNRSQGSGNFGRWGGALTFDSVGTNWNYDYTVAPTSGQNDLFSVALHEIGHALGIGPSDEFRSLISNGFFTGAESLIANGGTSYPQLEPDPDPNDPNNEPGHWLEGTASTVFGGTASQEAAMDPTITTGTRKLWTVLDAAALADIGWEVVTPAGLPGDYNNDNLVDAADYTVWRDSLGTGTVIGSYAEWRDNYGASASASGLAIPEPASLLLMLASVVGFAGLGRRC